MSSADQNSINSPNSGNFSKYRKATWFYNPFYRNFLKNWWDCFLRNLERPSNNFSTKFLDKNLEDERTGNSKSDENMYIYMDNVSETSQDEETFETVETQALKKNTDDNEDFVEMEEAKIEYSKEKSISKSNHHKKHDHCCGSEDEDSVDSDDSQKIQKIETASDLEKKVKKMFHSFLFLESLAVDLQKNYSNCASEPLLCIFSLHCPQREKSLKNMYTKIVKTRGKLRKMIQEEKQINI